MEILREGQFYDVMWDGQNIAWIQRKRDSVRVASKACTTKNAIKYFERFAKSETFRDLEAQAQKRYEDCVELVNEFVKAGMFLEATEMLIAEILPVGYFKKLRDIPRSVQH